MQYPKKLIHANGTVATRSTKNDYVIEERIACLSYQDLIDFGFTEQKDNRHPGRYRYPESDDIKIEDNDFFFISDRGNVCTRGSCAFEYADRGNAFQTEKEAEKELEKRKAIVTIKRYISDTFGVFEPDWIIKYQEKYLCFYDYQDNKFDHCFTHIHKYYSPIGYFSCEEHAQEILDKFDKELRLIWDIE